VEDVKAKVTDESVKKSEKAADGAEKAKD